ncbi:MAG: prepilin-type N-terminal cleavage/methylation domain-containing protein [Deltaproteobacteria bacterium]|nr:prepilin-type N-terminal cleavage/methylation domain-containing protein [Deltaproteobacteria bacterium]
MKKRADLTSTPGFSLLELILVMALIGLLTALIAPSLSNSLANVRLKTAVKKTAAIIRYAHNQAISKKKPFWVVFDREENQVTVVDRPLEGQGKIDNSKEASDSFPLSAKVYSYPEDVIIGKIKVGREEISEPQGAFVFYPNGSCSGGELLLKGNDSRAYRIKLDFITGTPKIEVDEKETD